MADAVFAAALCGQEAKPRRGWLQARRYSLEREVTTKSAKLPLRISPLNSVFKGGVNK